MTWREKPGPRLLRRSRVFHLAIGFLIVTGLAHLVGQRYGYDAGSGAACLGMALACVFGYAWEQSNASFRMGRHPFASAWDFAMFAIGGVAGLLGVLVCTV